MAERTMASASGAEAGTGSREAVAVFEDVRQSHPGNVPNLYNLGAAYEAKEDTRAAIGVYEHIRRLHIAVDDVALMRVLQCVRDL